MHLKGGITEPYALSFKCHPPIAPLSVLLGRMEGTLHGFGVEAINILMGDKVSLLRNSRSSLHRLPDQQKGILSPGLVQPSNKLYKLDGNLAGLLLD